MIKLILFIFTSKKKKKKKNHCMRNVNILNFKFYLIISYKY